VSYPETLNQLWADHLAPRAPSAPTVVSAFAGCGGSSLGYSAAGFRELLAIEWDDHAVSVFQRNFPGIPLHHRDITSFDPATLPVARGDLDILDGSPPCVGFSTAGLRHLTDPHNQLFREYIRLIEAWHPRVLVMENVSGMVKGKMRIIFAEILTALKSAGPGYRVSVRLLDASYLGVPQRRQRLIFIGVRDDLDQEPQHPHPHGAAMTFRDAVTDLTDPGLHLPLVGTHAKLGSHIPPGRNAGQVLAAAGKKPSFFALTRLAWDRPSFTIVKSAGFGYGALLHPDEDRYIGMKEMARIGSFPDQYDWGSSTYKQITTLVGNSAPPLMMRAVADTIRTRVLKEASHAHPAA
jgi:DNA (cytosine-5)-methyltransferase 1